MPVPDSPARRLHYQYYGCGLVYPPQLEGAKVLDLGSGTGRDCYVLSQLVGETGEVVGVDMTDEQLTIAERHLDYHTAAFGFAKPNVSFHKGYLETLNELDLTPHSFDVIVSNCVINLALDKSAVLRHAYNLLKPGGEIYFADVYCDRRVPTELANDPVLYGECLGGALYWNDFVNIAKDTGFLDPRLVDDRPIEISDPAINDKIGQLRFYSATYRLFKLPELEPSCEDYGQAVAYRGSLPEHASSFILDKHHHFEKGRISLVCGNTWRMLRETRFAQHFDFYGDGLHHFGIFEGCGTTLPFDDRPKPQAIKQSCC